MRRKLSAFIPVQNVEDIIEDCLESISWVDEIFIVDSYSEDKTEEICLRYPNVKLVKHKYKNSVEQRIWGMPQVTHDWIFIIDSDERCTARLRGEIEKILSLDDIPCEGYSIHIRTEFMGKLLHHDTYLGSGGKRLVLKEMSKNYIKKRVHAKMKIDKLSWIRPKQAYLVHIPIKSFGEQWHKMIRYATWAAEDMHENGKEVNWYHFLIRPWIKFIQYYIIRGGFFDGLRGIIMCAFGGMAVFMKYAKLWEMNHKKD